MSSEVEVQTENQVDDDPGGTEGKVMATLINGYIWHGLLIIDLNQIKLPAKVRKRGRPKGSEKTVIGLPRKKKCGNKTLPFLKKLPADRDKGRFCI